MKDSQTKTIEAPSLVESVRKHLIEDIMTRRFLPGQKLPVVEIAARYGVSETPVKQAFNRLISEGMLISLPRRGVVVRHISREDSRELMEARQMIYLSCVEAALAIPEDHRQAMRARLQQNLDEHRKLLDEVDGHLTVEVYLHYVKIDREYHAIYLECTRNRIIESFFQQLANQAYAYISLSELMAARVRQALVEHTAIFDAWWACDESAMVDSLKQHKQSAMASLDKVFKKERP